MLNPRSGDQAHAILNPIRESWRIAPIDPEEAARLSREVAHPWFRAQGLAAAARWSKDEQVESLALEALDAAAACEDDYQRAGVAAWPIRALVERGKPDLAKRALDTARETALRATPQSSSSEALLLLLQAAWRLCSQRRDQILRDVVDLAECGHWRGRMNAVAAVTMLATEDASAASRLADQIRHPKCRGKAQRALAARRFGGPREFFWQEGS